MSMIISSLFTNTKSALDALNTNTPAAPANPASDAEVNTMPNPTTSSDVVSPTAVKAISAQMAVNAQSLTDAAKKAAGVIGGATGLTAKQLEFGGVLPPGAGSHISALISKGMSASDAIGATTTGEAGVTSASNLVGNATKQVSIVQTVVTKSANELASAGILTGKENSLQSGGPILAAAAMGVDKVKGLFGSAGGGGITDALSKIDSSSISGVVGSLKDNLASGKLAGSLGDSLSGIGGGLKTSLGALGGGGDLKSTLESAFSSVEGSFGSMTGGVKNILGKSIRKEQQDPATTAAAGDYDSAKAEYAAAEDEYYAAKRDYRTTGEESDLARITDAEKKMAAAKQKMTKASEAFAKSAGIDTSGIKSSLSSFTSSLSSSVGGTSTNIEATLNNLGTNKESVVTSSQVTGLAKSLAGNAGLSLPGLNGGAGTPSLSSIIDKTGITTSATSGLNALPGGAGSLFTTLSKSTTGSSQASSLISSAGAGDLIAKAKDLGGSLVTNTTNSLKSLLGGSGGIANGASTDSLKKLAGGLMAQVESTMGAIPSASGIKSPIAAEAVNPIAEVKAKIGQLLGDPRIPTSMFNNAAKSPPVNADTNAMTELQKAALEDLENAQSKVRGSELNVSLTVKMWGNVKGAEEHVAKAKEGLEKALADLKVAQEKYDAVKQGGGTLAV